MPVLRETGASLGIGFDKCAAPEMFKGEQRLVKHIHDDTMTCLQPAERKIKYSQITKKRNKKSTRLENDDDQFRLGECVAENGEDFGPSVTGEDMDNGNLVKLSACVIIEAQLRSEESAHLIWGTDNSASDEASNQEGASMQFISVRHKVSTELYIDAIGPLPIVPIRHKYILPYICMSPMCHEAVPVPEKASTPLVEARLQIFRRRVSFKEIQTDEGTLFMSISTTELFEKLGMPLRKPFTFKKAFKYFRRVMPELPREHKKFDLSYLDNVFVFLEGWDFPIDHKDGILELNTHLAVRPAEFELAQNGVEYCGHVMGLGKQSPAQLKIRAIIDFSIAWYKTQVKVLGYDRQYIPMFSRLVTPVTET
ncbi:uncharacterized protein TNCV_1820341 [Trichonephila clavipes]|nr:uncharacterized protein TNCV_1820341 [Trichonephila clavipes]